MADQVVRVDVRTGYDLWSQSYEERSSTLVHLDRRVTPRHLRARPGERILDAGCGTGGHLGLIRRAAAVAIGLDFSGGMLAVARRSHRREALIQADLNQPLPVRDSVFDAVLCSLVSEHLTDLPAFFAELRRLLRPAGRLVFSAFHPAMAAAGVEANFESGGTEYRLGAELHTVEDYRRDMADAGFENLRESEYEVDATLVAVAPAARKDLGEPLLLMIEAERGQR